MPIQMRHRLYVSVSLSHTHGFESAVLVLKGPQKVFRSDLREEEDVCSTMFAKVTWGQKRDLEKHIRHLLISCLGFNVW